MPSNPPVKNSTSGPDPHRWLVLVYKTPVEPSTARVRIWRRVRELGGLYVQQAVSVFPNLPDLEQSLEELLEEIRNLSGEAYLFLAEAKSTSVDEALVNGFKAQSDQEYQEILEQLKGLLQELDEEARKGKYTFAEIEENEGDLAYITKWMERAARRDFFGADLGATVRDRLEECTAKMREFADEVFRRTGERP
ncbi:MAG TPA: hypothetical protein GX506_06170 [Firmicutes bacterium]|nr:hypothetical protein [Bacillota bacterium]